MANPIRIAGDLDVSGREREVGRLLQALEVSRRLDAAPVVSFVWGPPGIGKSFVLSAFEREASTRGIDVLRGAAARGGVRPYGLFSEVLPRALDLLHELGVPAQLAGELARRTIPVAGRNVLDRGEELVTAEDRRLDLFDAVASVLAHVGRKQPPVIMLDDVEAADGASLELLRYLLAAVAAPVSPFGDGQLAGRALWVVAFRDDSPLPKVLEEIVSRTPALTLPLDGLDRAGLRAFLSRSSVVDRILDSTGGVPEKIEALFSAGSDADVAELLVRRVGELGEVPRRALAVMAAFDVPVEPSKVEAALRAWTGDHLGSAVDELVAARMVALRAGGAGPRLYLGRLAEGRSLLAGLLAEERRGLHAAIGEVLANEGGDPVEVARHLRVADPEGAGLDWTIRAGEALAGRLAYGEAVEAFEQALEMLSDPYCERAVLLYERLQALHTSLSEHQRALRWLGRLKRAHRGDAARLRDVKSRVARACLAMGRARLVARICLEVLGLERDAFDSPDGGERALTRLRGGDVVTARVFADLVESLWTLGRYEQAMELARGGLELLGEGREGAAERISLRNTLGKLRLHRGEYREAEEQFRAGAREAESHELPRERGRALNNLGVVAHRRGKRREALDHYRRSLSMRQSCGDRAKEAFALQNIAALYHETGELESALDHYHRALAAFTRSRNTAQISRTASNLASLYLFLGDLERADALCDHSREAADEVSDPYLRGYASMVAGDIHRARGEAGEARRAYEKALDLFLHIDSPRYALETRLSLAALFCEEGEPTAAATLLHEVSDALEAQDFPGLAPELHLVSAELHLAAGDAPEASAHLARARDLLLETPDLEGPVRLYHLMSRVGEARGDEGGADANRARAERLLEELAARVPASHREIFLSMPRRRAVIDAAGGGEITPAGVRRALSLESKGPERSGEVARPSSGFPEIIGKNAKLRKVLSLVDRVASVSQPVLIRGPSGSGKELIADALHRRGPRRDGPFIKVNCAAMHEDLLLSELFGHEKGAFTGAHQMRKGRFELADGGTLFLDEIGDISTKVQVALLRVMQEQTFERVGGTKTLAVDVRVLCATNRDLERMMAAGIFREDLYYRLKGVMLEMPWLRERIDDLPELVEHFLQKCAGERGEPPCRVSPEAMAALSRYTWPGNIRELEQVMQSVSLFAEGGVIELDDLEHHPEISRPSAAGPTAVPAEAEGSVKTERPAAPSAPDAPPGVGEASADLFELARGAGLSLKDLKREVEERCIRRALEEAEGNISEAARLLGMKRSRLSQIVNADEDLRELASGRPGASG